MDGGKRLNSPKRIYEESPMDQKIDFKKFFYVLRDISSSLHSGSGVKDVLNTIVRCSGEAFKAKGAIIRILNPETQQLELWAAYGLSEQFLFKGPVFSDKIITELCRQSRIIAIRDILNDPRVQYPNEVWAEGIRMILDVPIASGEDIVGILRIFFAEPREFPEEEMNFLILIAERGTAVILRAKLIEMLESRYDQLALQTEKLSALGRMAAGIAHEINNPLAGILLYSTNLIKKVPNDGSIREGLEIIIQETLRCKTIIQDLLEFSREKEPTKVPSNVNNIVRKALSLLENEFRLHHIQLEVDLWKQLPEVLIDPNQIEQIFVNLLLNAIQAIDERGIVTIRSYVSPDRKKVGVEVCDNGCGISPEHMPRIFEPFFSTKVKGTGLGLAVTFGIVQRHGGQITAFSQPGKGARFTLEIPILSEISKQPCEGRNETG